LDQPPTAELLFGEPAPVADVLRVTRLHPPSLRRNFQPLPHPTGTPPFHLDLASVLPADRMAAIRAAGRLVFHIVGDTGGVRFPEPQRIVAMQLVADLQRGDPARRPSFLYFLGDDVYYYGAVEEYYPQFYEPYVDYHNPIFAIPGNHDGDLLPGSAVRSLDAFVRNFCADHPQRTPESGDTGRAAIRTSRGAARHGAWIRSVST
jgi:hypothetical protein